MIKVKGPDGSIANFPDGTPPEVMQNAMRQKFGGPQQQAAPSPAPNTGGPTLDELQQQQQAYEADNRPTPQQAGPGFVQGAMNAGISGINSATFGAAPWLAQKAAGMFGADPNVVQNEVKKANDYLGPVASGIIGIGAQMLPASRVIQGVGAGARALGMTGRLADIGVNAVGGAGIGAADAIGHGGDVTSGAGVGALAGAGGGLVGQAVGGTVSKIAGMLGKKPVIPTGAELNAAKTAAYKASEDAGVIVNPTAADRLAQMIKAKMADFGYDPTLQRGGGAVLSSLEGNAGQNVTLKGLETLRKVAGRMREGGDSGAQLARNVKGEIDAFTNGLGPADIVSGNAPAGVDALNKARGLAQTAFKSDKLDESLLAAKNRAASTGSGGNVENATRQNIRKMLEGNTAWTPDERAALQSVVSGTKTGDALRLIGKLSPTGNGLMTALHAGALLPSSGMSGLLALGGMGAKKLSEAGASGRVSALGDVIRNGGIAPKKQTAINQKTLDQIIRMLSIAAPVAASQSSR